MIVTVPYTPNARQREFHACGAEQVFYGGAKGGGKSCALVMEALAYGLEHPGAQIYLFRETYDDLEANLIKEWKDKAPKELQAKPFNNSGHYATLINGTEIKFRYIRSLQDAEGYQGRSMDFIGVDELTKHERASIQILLSCLRSPKGYPARFRATGNPGGVGHTYVKQDYIQATNYGKIVAKCKVTDNRIAYIPATVYDNDVLMRNDPNYVKRLENLPDKERKAFLHGDWDIFEGQYFEEFNRAIHVIEPFEIPKHWKRYTTLDYGLDMLAHYWLAMDTNGNAYVYKELYKSGLIVSEAARDIKRLEQEQVSIRYAPPDMWNRHKDTGKSTTDIFADNKLYLTRASNNRVQGWYNVKEWLKPYKTRHEQTGGAIVTARLKIFANCKNLIRTLPELQRSEKDPNDVATEPHELTHAPDALRYFLANRPIASDELERGDDDEDDDEDVPGYNTFLS